MIKRLRRKFILINLLLVGLVLAVVFILFVGANARRLAGQSDAALRLALSWQEREGRPALKSAARRRRSTSRTGRTASP
ncbi:MAG: hypothetical protein ACLRWQ_13665 [Flavonifractor plautii]